MSFPRFATLLAPAIAILIAGCGGGGGGGGAAYDGGALLCDVMIDSPHRYSAAVIFDSVAPDTPILGAPAAPPPFHIESTIEAAAEDGDTIHATIHTTDGGALNSTVEAIIDGAARWLRNGEQPWQDLATANADYSPIAYRPLQTCQALAVDFDPSTLSGEDEEVDGISGKRYDLTDFRSDFPDRMPDIGTGSVVSGLVNVFAGSVWVADAGYVSRLDLTGVGTYSDGTTLSARFTYTISDRGDDISVDLPTA